MTINNQPQEAYFSYEDAGIKLLNEKFCPDDPIVSTRNIKKGLYEGEWSYVDGFNKKYEVEFKFRTSNQDTFGFTFEKGKCKRSSSIIFDRFVGLRCATGPKAGQSICPGGEVKDLLLVIQHDLWRDKYITQVFNLSAEYDLFSNNCMLSEKDRPWKGKKKFNYSVPLVKYDYNNYQLTTERCGVFVDDPVTQPRKKIQESYDKVE